MLNRLFEVSALNDTVLESVVNRATTRCTVCSSAKVNPGETIGGYGVVRCTSCSHRFVSQPIERALLDRAYSASYYGVGEGETPSVGYTDYLGKAQQRMEAFRSRLRMISGYTDRPGTILDFGCAVGLFLKVAQEAGWKARGYERSAWAVDYGRREFGLDIALGTGESNPFEEASFDVVTLWDVLEHVERPGEIMSLARGWLKDRGIIALNTIDASSLGARLAGRRWRHLTPPHHLQFYSRRSLKRLLAAHGFRVLFWTTNGTCLNAAAPEKPSFVSQRIDDVVRYWRVRPIVSLLGLLDEVEVIAQKI